MERAVWLTGAGGFVGSWLRRRLTETGRRCAALAPAWELSSLDCPATLLDLEHAALCDPGQEVLDLDALPEPEGLVHLAAVASPPACEADPPRARAVNAIGPARLYEQLLHRWPELPILHVSTAYVYRPASGRLAEDQELIPVNVYGATKLHGEAVALGLRDRGCRVSVVRPFNHSGPGQSPEFALPAFAQRLAKLEAAGGGVLQVGRLDGVRDYLHVREVADAYVALLPKAGELDVVNVCSGEGQTMQQLLDALRARFTGEVDVRQDPGRMRGSADADRLVGDPTRLRALLGSVPAFDRDGLLDELAAEARSRLAGAS